MAADSDLIHKRNTKLIKAFQNCLASVIDSKSIEETRFPLAFVAMQADVIESLLQNKPSNYKL